MSQFDCAHQPMSQISTDVHSASTSSHQPEQKAQKRKASNRKQQPNQLCTTHDAGGFHANMADIDAVESVVNHQAAEVFD